MIGYFLFLLIFVILLSFVERTAALSGDDTVRIWSRKRRRSSVYRNMSSWCCMRKESYLWLFRSESHLTVDIVILMCADALEWGAHEWARPPMGLPIWEGYRADHSGTTEVDTVWQVQLWRADLQTIRWDKMAFHIFYETNGFELWVNWYFFSLTCSRRL